MILGYRYSIRMIGTVGAIMRELIYILLQEEERDIMLEETKAKGKRRYIIRN